MKRLTERDRFESYMRLKVSGDGLNRENGTRQARYVSFEVDQMWQGWQARARLARRAKP